MNYKLYKVTYQGLVFEVVGSDKKVLVDFKILKIGRVIYTDDSDYDEEDIEDYIIDEDFQG